MSGINRKRRWQQRDLGKRLKFEKFGLQKGSFKKIIFLHPLVKAVYENKNYITMFIRLKIASK